MLSRSSLKLILIAGTNGKTTTSSLIRTALEAKGKRVIHNESGANLLNGIASTLIINTNLLGKLNQDYAIFEVDENTLPLILKEIKPDYLLLLNLFRDQLDRYGEVDAIAKKWQTALKILSRNTTVILNADDPRIAFLANSTNAQIKYFGLNCHCEERHGSGRRGNLFYLRDCFAPFVARNDKMLQHAVDSIYCPRCGNKLHFTNLSFSHLGDWSCKHCGLKRAEVDIGHFDLYPLPGVYNKYNTIAAALLLKQTGLNNRQIKNAFKKFSPAFGRQELISYKGKKIQIFLSKNPTSFNESFKTIKDLNAKTLLLVLNDRIPDGRDVSWIWDVDLPGIEKFKNILISGDRVYDMALRIKYAEKFQIPNSKFQTFEKLDEAIKEGLNNLKSDETLYILPTYSAMLEVRKILTGKKIL